MLLVGETAIDVPVPITVEPQDPENHCGAAPVPAEPPVKVKVVFPP